MNYRVGGLTAGAAGSSFVSVEDSVLELRFFREEFWAFFIGDADLTQLCDLLDVFFIKLFN